MRLAVDAWDPGYGTGMEAGGSPDTSSAKVDTEVELPAASWRPLSAPADASAPSTVLVVDGVRRVEARVWITDDDGVTAAGLAASYAAGVVRCDLRRGVAEVAVTRTERGLFTSSTQIGEVGTGSARYPMYRVGRDDPMDLLLGVQRHLRQLEIVVAGEARGHDGDTDDLLIIDGPLQGRAHLPRALGYVKSHRVEYLSPELAGVVTALRPGERCPVFGLGTSWNRYAWYLRLPGPAGSPWAGIVRAECSSDLTTADAVRMANQSIVTLPRFASAAYKDPRAPQNLVPIAGLERRLRATLGDARLLHRCLTTAARRTGPGAFNEPVPAQANGRP